MNSSLFSPNPAKVIQLAGFWRAYVSFFWPHKFFYQNAYLPVKLQNSVSGTEQPTWNDIELAKNKKDTKGLKGHFTYLH